MFEFISFNIFIKRREITVYLKNIYYNLKTNPNHDYISYIYIYVDFVITLTKEKNKDIRVPQTLVKQY